MSAFYKHFSEQLDGLEAPVVLGVINPLFYQQANSDAVRFLSERLSKGVYISLNKPYATQKMLFEKAGIPPGKLFFIDFVSDSPPQELEDCMVCGKMQNLTNLCLTVSKVMEKVKDYKFLYLDSLSTLLVYNDSKSVLRFGHIMTERLRKWNLYGILMSVDLLAERDTISQMAQFCDLLIKLE